MSALVTPERIAILRRDFPAGVAGVIILEQLNALPGGRVESYDVHVMVDRLKLRRPAGFDPIAANRAAKIERVNAAVAAAATRNAAGNRTPSVDVSRPSFVDEIQRRPGSDDICWTDRAIEILTALWAAGLSSNEIGRRMGASKNGVVGKAHRLGLPSRPSPIKRTGEHRRRKSRLARDRVTLPKLAALMAEASSPAALDAESTPVTGGGGTSQIVRRRAASAPSRVVMLRPTQISTSPCQWPYGEPRTKSFRFCGAPETVIGKPYCPDHCCVAYMRVPDRQEDAA